jgi:hypothetical protein
MAPGVEGGWEDDSDPTVGNMTDENIIIRLETKAKNGTMWFGV